VDLGRMEASRYVKQLNAAAMALSSRMRVDPPERVALAVDFFRGSSAAVLGTAEIDVASRYFLTYPEFSR